jgi:pentapeptide MXKDX repeat protein
MQAIDNGRAHSLRRGLRRAITNLNPRRTKNMLKRISALFITVVMLVSPAVLPTFAQDKMEGQDKMKDKDKMVDQDKISDKDKMAEKGKKSKTNKRGDKMEGGKMKDDKMKEKKP